MSNLTWNALRAEFWRLYESEAYAEALDLVTREADTFPEYTRPDYYNWRMCMAARVGDISLALQVFEQAIAVGYWYGDEALRQDADVQPLQGLPEYERLVAISLERQATALAQAKPVLTILEPVAAPQPYPLLIALHGNYNNVPASLEHWRPAVTRGWLLALPQSSQIVEPDRYVWNDRERAVQEIQQHYAAICAQYPVDPTRVVIGGFSKGGGLAPWLALSGAVAARGFVAVAPSVPDIDGLIHLLDSRPDQPIRGYIVAGERDTHYLKDAQDLVVLMKSRHIPCELELHPDLDHDFPPNFEQSLEQALRFVLYA